MASQDQSQRNKVLTANDPTSLAEMAKLDLGILKSNNTLTDTEIAEVCKWIGERAPDTSIDGDGGKTLSRMGIDAMLFISMTVFPDFYRRKELAQFN